MARSAIVRAAERVRPLDCCAWCGACDEPQVLSALHAASDDAAAARRALVVAQEEGRRRDGLVLRNQQLESARHFDRVAQDRELRLMQTAHNKQISEMQVGQRASCEPS
jgi:hypothetical protein